MKLKTQEEIDGIWMEDFYDSQDDYQSERSFLDGYERAQTDLVEQASEGFQEWLLSVMGEQTSKVELSGMAWQASRLSCAKEIQEKDALIEKLLNDISNLKGKLKTENHYKFTECDCPAGMNCECED